MHGVSLGDDLDVLKLIVMMAAELCTYANNHRISCFNWENYMACELNLNKPVIFKVYT